ncbi:MAG: putative urea ABC transporter substrate-binding protein [Geminicoccaceae bacterium]|nr:putative urea ABC transporter substrate-binding protein [Geminicoccaceae bacterium]MCX8100378.1 putative urea ABC transporter substrate-binding protein [Geminicoccaceae bacterium]MDW8369502.1 putative urea ABC transporter substrate-binding protein [Geminicoccaceae bacterium]
MRRIVLVLAMALLVGLWASPQAAARSEFKIAWSIYVGWMPWGWAADRGIVKKWADRYGLSIEVVQINDYVESINQYTAGAFDGCAMTNMDALTIPAVGGVDSTALIVGDFSNGNDGIVSKTARDLRALAGERINLVELSVSHYLLARALESVGLSERDVTVVNTSDADILGVFQASPDVRHIVTWNPLLSEAAALPGARRLFDSSQIPGEIIDLMVVRTEALAANPNLGKALVGAWYETMAIMRRDDEAGRAARSAMARASGTDLAGFDAQLATTRMFWEPAEAVAFTRSAELVRTMDRVRRFSHEKGLLGGGLDTVGIAFADGTVLGDPKNVKLRFDPSFMARAAEGGL